MRGLCAITLAVAGGWMLAEPISRPTASPPRNTVRLPYYPGIIIPPFSPEKLTFDRKVAADGDIRVELAMEVNGVPRHNETRDYATSGRWVHFQTEVDIRAWGIVEGDTVTSRLTVTSLTGPYAGVSTVEVLALPVGRATVDPCPADGGGGGVVPLPTNP